MVHLSDLSAELRVRIYHFVFRNLEVQYSFRSNADNTKMIGDGLLFACKWLHAETKPVFLNNARINISIWLPDCLGFRESRFRASQLRYVAVNLTSVLDGTKAQNGQLANDLSQLTNLRELTYYFVLSWFTMNDACFDGLQPPSDNAGDFSWVSTVSSKVNSKGIKFIQDNAAMVVGQRLSGDRLLEARGLLQYWISTKRRFKLVAQVQIAVDDTDGFGLPGTPHSVRPVLSG